MYNSPFLNMLGQKSFQQCVAKQNTSTGQHFFYLDSEQYLLSVSTFPPTDEEPLTEKTLTEHLLVCQALS